MAHDPAPTLVTGGSGFMGRALVRRLLGAGRAVTILDLAPPPADVGGATFIRASVTDSEAVTAAVRAAGAVVHLAAKVSDAGRRRDFERLNVEATRLVATAARDAGVRRFVHMSSVAVFDYRPGHRGTDETHPIGGHEFPYGRTKAAAETLLRALATRDFAPTIVRPGLVPYGPGDRLTSAGLLGATARGVPWLVDGGGALLGTAYVENLVDGLLLCLDHPAAPGETFHLADDVRITWRELHAAIARALGGAPAARSIPRFLAAPAAAAVEAAWLVLGRTTPPPLARYRIRTATCDLHFANAKAQRVLGWTPRVGLDEGLAATVAWWRAGMP